MANSVLRQTVHTSLARTLLNEVLTRSVKYYFSYGKTDSWGTETVPDALDTLDYELLARKNTVFLKEVVPSDACLVIPRYNWVNGSVYDDYDQYSPSRASFSGATSLDEAIYYVMTDEYNVYKCLSNAAGASSTVKPTGTSVSPFQTEDNYIWKFMYTVPTYLRNKFLSSTQMPVTVAIQNAYYSDGKIEKFTITSKGAGYKPNKILAGTVSSSGTNYRKIYGSGTQFLTASTPIGTLWTANTNVYAGQKLYYSTRAYTVAAAGKLGSTAPTHTTGTVANGTATLTYTGVLQYDTSARLAAGDYIMINNEVRVIASVESDTELTIRSTDPQLYVGTSSQITKVNTYVRITSGDGYKESNPYIITGVTITNGGSGYGTDPYDVLVEFSEPTLPGGRVAQGTAVVNANGNIIGVTLDDAGYGYAIPPKITFTSTTGLGSGAAATPNTIRSRAYIDPVVNDTTGEILNARILDPGIGYTYCNVVVESVPTAGIETSAAAISVDVNLGQINTQQATVEAAAINGAIHVIKMDNPGAGYTNATITVTGDGTGCTAVPVIDGGAIRRVVVTNPGKEYTYANITITTTDTPSVAAVGRAIISPPGGHGKNAIDELGGRTILFYNRLETTPIKGITVSSDYRQVCLYKQPKAFGSQLLYNGLIGSTCYKMTVEVSGKPALSTIPLNTELRVVPANSTSTFVRFKLIARTTNSVLLQALDNNDEQVRTGYRLRHSNGVDYYTITVVDKPDVEKLQGEIIYIDNRQAFKALADQPVSISSRFKL